jgi:hypothetical protein
MSEPGAKYVAPGFHRGFRQEGNIDISKRPEAKNPDGSVSTVRSMSINVEGNEVLIPTVSEDARIMSDSEAVDTYRRTGRHLGIFDTPSHATAYAKSLHEDQAQLLKKKRKLGS